MKNKRGLSTIVITLIIIVLALVAVGILWAVVSNILQKNSNQANLGLTQFTLNLDITNAYEQGGNININVMRAVGSGELTKIKFILSDNANSETIIQDSSMKELDAVSFVIHPTSLTSAEITSVSVAPVFKSSDGSEITGSITDTYHIGITSEGTCGDGVINTGEQCDGENFNGMSCSSLGFTGGVLSCSNCQIGTSFCIGASEGNCGGNCAESEVCTNGFCVPLDCVPEPLSSVCGTWTCGNKYNNCGVEVSCGSCASGKICNPLGSCEDVIVINSGKVEETWPGTSGLYFGSTNLPTTEDYSGTYIKFPGSSEARCLLIALYRFPVEGYSKSHIGFNFQTSIITGDDYQIFRTAGECQA
jgi:hypothetical protein